MIKLFRSIKSEHRKLWAKRSALWCLIAMMVLGALTTLACSSLDVEKLSIGGNDYSYAERLSASAVSSSDASADPDMQYANAAAKRLNELEVKLPLASPSEKYSLQREKSELLYKGSIAAYRAQYGVPEDDSLTCRVQIYALWLLVPLAVLCSVVLTSDMFAGEYARGTIAMILCRPVTRIRQYIAKQITAQLYSALLVLSGFAAVYFTSLGLLGDDCEKKYVGYMNNSVYETTWMSHTLVVLICCCVTVLAMITLCAFLSNLTRSRTASAMLTMGVLIVSLYMGNMIGDMGSVLSGLSIFSCLDLTIPLCGVANYAPLGFSECAASVGMHIVIFVICGYLSFRRDAV